MKLDEMNVYDRLVAQETLIFDAAEEICRAMDENDVTRRELGERLGCGKSNVSQIFSGRNLTLRSLADLASALDCRFKITIEAR